ncbi:hypothetical protein, partial [Thiolapillus sp.]|uniref:hypothetical protein n=1 Tax=Thiolapillus sp. TaxID=2017437 RepID=UPI003AF56663
MNFASPVSKSLADFPESGVRNPPCVPGVEASQYLQLHWIHPLYCITGWRYKKGLSVVAG